MAHLKSSISVCVPNTWNMLKWMVESVLPHPLSPWTAHTLSSFSLSISGSLSILPGQIEIVRKKQRIRIISFSHTFLMYFGEIYFEILWMSYMKIDFCLWFFEMWLSSVSSPGSSPVVCSALLCSLCSCSLSLTQLQHYKRVFDSPLVWFSFFWLWHLVPIGAWHEVGAMPISN